MRLITIMILEEKIFIFSIKKKYEISFFKHKNVVIKTLGKQVRTLTLH